MGEFDLYHSEVSTLAWDPTFVPEVGLKGLTWNSISIGWNSPPENFIPYIQYYKLNRKTDDQEVSFIIMDSVLLQYLFFVTPL
jgi:hypothetical protein